MAQLLFIFHLFFSPDAKRWVLPGSNIIQIPHLKTDFDFLFPYPDLGFFQWISMTLELVQVQDGAAILVTRLRGDHLKHICVLLCDSGSSLPSFHHQILTSILRDRNCYSPFYKEGNWGRFHPCQGSWGNSTTWLPSYIPDSVCSSALWGRRNHLDKELPWNKPVLFQLLNVDE